MFPFKVHAVTHQQALRITTVILMDEHVFSYIIHILGSHMLAGVCCECRGYREWAMAAHDVNVKNGTINSTFMSLDFHTDIIAVLLVYLLSFTYVLDAVGLFKSAFGPFNTIS